MEVDTLFKGLFSWWAIPEARMPMEESFLGLQQLLLALFQFRDHAVEASMTRSVSSLISGRPGE